MALAREAGSVFAWDDADQLYRIDPRGQFQSVARAPGKILHGAVSDDGSLVALLGEGTRLWLLNGDFELVHDRSVISDPISIAVDPHGRYVAVGSKMNAVQFYTRHAKQAGKFETRQPLSSLIFVPDKMFLVGIGSYGSIAGIELSTVGGNGSLDGDIVWYEALMSSTGRLATTGDGQMILVSCFGHGIQRYDLEGRSEGAYHLGGSAAHAVPDFPGRSIAVATLEGELAILSGAGNVKWRTSLTRPAMALETDALGRYLVYGQTTGEIVRIDFQLEGRPASTPVSTSKNGSSRSRIGHGSVRVPQWTADVVQHEDQAEFAVLAVCDDPGRIGVITHQNKLEIFTSDGKRLGQAPEIDGVGRIVRTSSGWMAAATDRRIVLCDLRKNQAQRLDLSLCELTHLAIEPDSYGLGIVQERDRVGRATLAGRWIWKTELHSPVEDLAISTDGFTAVTTEDGLLRIYNPAGAPAGEFRGPPSDPALLIASPDGSLAAWLTLTRRSQVLRGHDRSGRVLWESPVPWEAWQFLAVGTSAVAVAPDGRVLVYDSSGHALAQGRGEGVPDAFCQGPKGEPLRVSRQGVHLICSDVGGSVAWRAVADATIGPLATGKNGLAVLIGKSLAWFPSELKN
jgi:WD40 repeat protein